MCHAGVALRAALVAALLSLAACDKPSEKLQADIAKASELQSVRQDASSTSQEVDLAPAANLTSGTGDIGTTSKCAEDITIFCPSVKPGYAHIAECLSNQIFDERDGNSEYTVKVSAPCRATVLNFKMRLAENINLDVNMAAACKDDAKKFCDYTKDYKFPGKVIACLREKKTSLTVRRCCSTLSVRCTCLQSCCAVRVIESLCRSAHCMRVLCVSTRDGASQCLCRALCIASVPVLHVVSLSCTPHTARQQFLHKYALADQSQSERYTACRASAARRSRSRRSRRRRTTGSTPTCTTRARATRITSAMTWRRAAAA